MKAHHGDGHTPTVYLKPRTHHGPVIAQRGPDFVPNEIIGLIIEQVEDIQDIVKLRSVSPQFCNYIDDSIIIQQRLFRLPNYQNLSKTGPSAGWPQPLPTLPSGYAIENNADDDCWPDILSLHLKVSSDTTESNDHSTPILRFEDTSDYWKDMYITQPPINHLHIFTRHEYGEHREWKAFSLNCRSGIKVWHIMHVLEREKESHHMHGNRKCCLDLQFMIGQADVDICDPLHLMGSEDLAELY